MSKEERKEKSIYDHDLQIVGEVNIASAWQQSKEYRTGRSQTEAMPRGTGSTQTVLSALQVNEQCDKETETRPRGGAMLQPIMDGMQYVYKGDHYDEAELADLLEGVVDELSTLLLNNNKSTAYDGYTPNWVERLDNVASFTTLTPTFALEDEYHATSLSWNSTGSSVAVGYGRVDTVGWCKKKGFVCVWNLNRRELNPSHADLTLETSSYVTAVAFHPTMPSTLAAGTYNGEVMIWNLAAEGEDKTGGSVGGGSNLNAPMSSIGCSQAPKEPIARLRWLQNFQEQNILKRYLLCSASQDGKILFWNPYRKLAEPEAAFDVQNRKHCIIGVNGMAFVHGSSSQRGAPLCPSVDNIMILGVESGEIFRTKANLTGGTSRNVLDVDHYASHSGPVHSIDCSPFFRHLFLSSSSDGCVRLYSTLERSPLATLEPSVDSKHFLYNAQFSPYRASVLAAVSRSSHLHIYDLERSRSKPSISVEAGIGGCPVLSLAFNAANPKLMATGDMKGNVRLWQLSSVLYTATELERSAIRAASDSAAQSSPKREERERENEAEDREEDEGAPNPIRDLFGFNI